MGNLIKAIWRSSFKFLLLAMTISSTVLLPIESARSQYKSIYDTLNSTISSETSTSVQEEERTLEYAQELLGHLYANDQEEAACRASSSCEQILKDYQKLPLSFRTEDMMTHVFPSVPNKPSFSSEYRKAVTAILALNDFIKKASETQFVQQIVQEKFQKLEALNLKETLKNLQVSDNSEATQGLGLVVLADGLSPQEKEALFKLAWGQVSSDTDDLIANALEQMTPEQLSVLEIQDLESSLSTIIQSVFGESDVQIGSQSQTLSGSSLKKGLMAGVDFFSSLIVRPAFAQVREESPQLGGDDTGDGSGDETAPEPEPEPVTPKSLSTTQKALIAAAVVVGLVAVAIIAAPLLTPIAIATASTTTGQVAVAVGVTVGTVINRAGGISRVANVAASTKDVLVNSIQSARNIIERTPADWSQTGYDLVARGADNPVIKFPKFTPRQPLPNPNVPKVQPRPISVSEEFRKAGESIRRLARERELRRIGQGGPSTPSGTIDQAKRVYPWDRRAQEALRRAGEQLSRKPGVGGRRIIDPNPIRIPAKLPTNPIRIPIPKVPSGGGGGGSTGGLGARVPGVGTPTSPFAPASLTGSPGESTPTFPTSGSGSDESLGRPEIGTAGDVSGAGIDGSSVFGDGGGTVTVIIDGGGGFSYYDPNASGDTTLRLPQGSDVDTARQVIANGGQTQAGSDSGSGSEDGSGGTEDEDQQSGDDEDSGQEMAGAEDPDAVSGSEGQGEDVSGYENPDAVDPESIKLWQKLSGIIIPEGPDTSLEAGNIRLKGVVDSGDTFTEIYGETPRSLGTVSVDPSPQDNPQSNPIFTAITPPTTSTASGDNIVTPTEEGIGTIYDLSEVRASAGEDNPEICGQPGAPACPEVGDSPSVTLAGLSTKSTQDKDFQSETSLPDFQNNFGPCPTDFAYRPVSPSDIPESCSSGGISQVTCPIDPVSGKRDCGAFTCHFQGSTCPFGMVTSPRSTSEFACVSPNRECQSSGLEQISCSDEKRKEAFAELNKNIVTSQQPEGSLLFDEKEGSQLCPAGYHFESGWISAQNFGFTCQVDQPTYACGKSGAQLVGSTDLEVCCTI